METKELMVGDLITINVEAKEFVAKAICIDKDIVTIDLQEECTLHYYRAYKEFNPIPLTEEILLANGFEKSTYIGGFLIDIFPFRVRINAGGFKAEDTPVDEIVFNALYVHELQHALRLCGLTDLADNFKIK